MAVNLNSSAENLDATTPGTVAVTVVGNANRVAIGWIFASAGVGTPTATFAGNAMTSIQTATTAGGRLVTMFAIKGDASIPTGSQTFSVTFTAGAGTVGVGVMVFDGADQTTGWQNATTSGPTTSTAESITITSANGNMVCACSADDNATGRTLVSGTSQWQETAGDGNYLGSNKASTTGSTVLSWTLGSSVSWVMNGIDIIAAAGAPVVALEWKQPTSQPTNHYNNSIIMSQSQSPPVIPWLVTKQTFVTGTFDWIMPVSDIDWTVD